MSDGWCLGAVLGQDEGERFGMEEIMKRIGMLTSGGDCQALNAAMRGVVKGICSKRNDVEIYGFKDGYKGLIYADFSMLTS